MDTAPNHDRQVAGKLQQIITQLTPGEKLPSLRTLAKELAVSVQVVDRTLARLAAAGQIFIKPRSGAFKSMPLSRRVEILIMESSVFNKQPFAYFFFSRMVTELVCSGRQVRVHDLASEAEDKKLHGIGSTDESLIITFRLQINQMHIVDFFHQKGVPTVHILPNFTDMTGHTLTLDDRLVVEQQLDALQRFGHRKIAYFHAADPNRYVRSSISRHAAFCSLAIARGLPLLPEYVAFVGHDCEELPQAVAKLRQSKEPPTAVIIYDTHAKMVYDELRRQHFEPGKDIAVIAMDDLPWDAMLSPSLSSVRIEQATFAPSILAAMTRAETGAEAKTEYFPIETMIRQSLFQA